MTDQIHATIAQLAVPVAGLQHYGRNPRRGNVDLIAESLQHHGQYKPIVVRTGTMEVLAGNHTLRAAKQLGWDQIAATFVDVDDDQAARIVLVDNRSNDVAGYDETELAELLTSLPDLGGTGFDQASLDELVHGLEQEPAEAPDEADELPEPTPTIARTGDVFDLGEHRVICGDATDPEVLARVLASHPADAMWTDPPYGVEYVGKTEQALRIRNDGADDLDQLLTDAFTAAAAALRPGAPVYVAHTPGPDGMKFQVALESAGFSVRQNLIWVKNAMVLGHSDYQYRHEPILEAHAPGAEPEADEQPGQGKGHDPILYGFAPGGAGRLGRGGPRWYGTNNRTTVFEVPKPPASREHPTMKPVKLILAMLANSVRPGQSVLDPFAGSGSTLIAAHYHGARARVVELDPHYVDVICARYQRLTGTTPVRAGKTVDFLEGQGA